MGNGENREQDGCNYGKRTCSDEQAARRGDHEAGLFVSIFGMEFRDITSHGTTDAKIQKAQVSR